MKYDPRKKRTSEASGHYASLWFPGGSGVAPTTITNQRKSHAREAADKKRRQLLAEIQELTGVAQTGYARSYDATVRRWSGVKANGSD